MSIYVESKIEEIIYGDRDSYLYLDYYFETDELVELDCFPTQYEIPSYNVAYSSKHGYPFYFVDNEDNVTYKCITSSNYNLYLESSDSEELTKSIEVTKNQTVIFATYNDFDISNEYVDVIIYSEGHIVGDIVIVFNSVDNCIYPDVLSSKIYPRINNQYQEITQDYVEK